MIRRVTISPYRYEFEYSEFACKFVLNVYRVDCRVIENMQLCVGETEIIDNVSIKVVDDDINNVTVQRVNQPVDAPLVFGALLDRI